MINYLIYITLLIFAIDNQSFRPAKVDILGFTYHVAYFSERYYFLFFVVLGIYIFTHILIRAQNLNYIGQLENNFWNFYGRVTAFMILIFGIEMVFYFIVYEDIDLFFSFQPIAAMYLFNIVSIITGFTEERYYKNNIISVEIYHKNSQQLLYLPLMDDEEEFSPSKFSKEKLLLKSMTAILLASIVISKDLGKQNEIVRFNYEKFFKHAFVDDKLGIIIVFNTKYSYLAFEKSLMENISSILRSKYESIFQNYLDLANLIPSIEGLDVSVLQAIGAELCPFPKNQVNSRGEKLEC